MLPLTIAMLLIISLYLQTKPAPVLDPFHGRLHSNRHLHETAEGLLGMLPVKHCPFPSTEKMCLSRCSCELNGSLRSFGRKIP